MARSMRYYQQRSRPTIKLSIERRGHLRLLYLLVLIQLEPQSQGLVEVAQEEIGITAEETILIVLQLGAMEDVVG